MAIVLVFLWKDRLGSIKYPDEVPSAPEIVTPAETYKAMVADVKVDGILPADRIYYAGFYNSLDWVVANDGKRATRVIDTTEKFRRFHAGSLDVAVDLKKVGAYPGLGEAIDKAFALAAWGGDPSSLRTPADVSKAVEDGLTPRPMTNALEDRLRKCAAALAWKLTIRGE